PRLEPPCLAPFVNMPVMSTFTNLTTISTMPSSLRRWRGNSRTFFTSGVSQQPKGDVGKRLPATRQQSGAIALIAASSKVISITDSQRIPGRRGTQKRQVTILLPLRFFASGHEKTERQ